MSSDNSQGRWVFGLCADWCGVCREWHAAFDAAAAAHPGDSFVWVDIEDDDDLVGDLDIETFPTLLVGAAGQVVFFGAIMPAPELLTRLLASLDGSRTTGNTPQSAALLERLVSAQL